MFTVSNGKTYHICNHVQQKLSAQAQCRSRPAVYKCLALTWYSRQFIQHAWHTMSDGRYFWLHIQKGLPSFYLDLRPPVKHPKSAHKCTRFDLWKAFMMSSHMVCCSIVVVEKLRPAPDDHQIDYIVKARICAFKCINFPFLLCFKVLNKNI